MKINSIVSPGSILTSDVVLVDIGARNGMLDLRSISDMVTAYGFEPSAQEYEKLLRGRTDLDLAMPGYRPTYRAEKYAPYAVSNLCGEVQLYITRGAGASSILRPNAEFLRRFRRKNWSDVFDVQRIETVQSRTLRSFLEESGIACVDLLKLDTQGNEFDILDDTETLKRIGIVKTEVEFVEMYEGQKLYSDVARLMRDNGFLQFDLRFDRVHYRGQCSEPLDGGVLAWGDAYFLNEQAADRETICRRVLVLFDLGNDDLAFHLARRTNALSNDVLTGLHRWFMAYRDAKLSTRQRLRRLLERTTGLRVSRVPK